MLTVLAELLIAPVLVAFSTLAARRWGAAAGGVVSAFPAVAGPVLLIVAQQRGADFAARTANATLLGVVALSAFAVAYARCALRCRWQVSLIAGWGLSAVLAAILSLWGHGVGFPGGLAAASVSLVAAHRAIPHAWEAPVPQPQTDSSRADIPLRMAATALLIAVLTTAAETLGPLIGGILTGLPVLASVLAVFTHRAHGPRAVVTLLRGMLAGMAGFVGFCATVAVLTVPAGVAPAFAVAAVGAVALHAAMLGANWLTRRQPA
jgi:hypothetical protein